MKHKPIIFIYKVIQPFAIGFIIMTLVQKLVPELIVRLDPFQLFILMFLLLMTAFILLEIIKKILFGRKNTLATKMMKCTLRKQYGLDYCVKCPDSYSCPAEGK